MYTQLEDIIIQTKKRFFSNLYGEHLSIFNGNGLEFNELKEYTIDDDIRHINWKITARTRQPNVNLFFDHKKIDIALVYLNSGGLDFGKEKSKKSTAVDIISSLGYLGTYHKDNLCTLFFDTKERSFLPPSSDKYTVHRNYECALNLDPKGCQIDYKKLNDAVFKNIRPRSIIFIIGDFLKLPDLELLSSAYEIYALVIRDRNEEKLNINGEYNFIDTSSLKKQNITVDAATIKNYNEYMQKYDKELKSYFEKLNINNFKIYTHKDSIQQLKNFLKGQNGR